MPKNLKNRRYWMCLSYRTWVLTTWSCTCANLCYVTYSSNSSRWNLRNFTTSIEFLFWFSTFKDGFGGERAEGKRAFELHSINIWSRTVRFVSQGNFLLLILKVESGPNTLLSRLHELQKERAFEKGKKEYPETRVQRGENEIRKEFLW